MPSFGIIAEGITDQIVIEQVILGAFDGGDEDDEPVVNYVQPLLDRTAQAAAPAAGGWTLVFQYLKLDKHREALQSNDYLVLQIDTDVCDEKGFDVPRQEGGKALSPAELAARVTAKLQTMLGADVLEAHAHRILFAIAVDGIECWLLPLVFTNNKAGKTTGCLGAMNHELRKQKRTPLSKADGEAKDPRAYKDVARAYADSGKLRKLAGKNPSLGLFVDQLDEIPRPAASE